MTQNVVTGADYGATCPECQGDGVPCSTVHVACAECGRAIPPLPEHAGERERAIERRTIAHDRHAAETGV